MRVHLCVASLFGAAGSAGTFSFSTTTAAAAAPSAAAPQPAGFTPGGGQTATSGLAFGSATLGVQPQTASTQAGASLPGFSLPTTATAGTGQAGGFQFGGVQSTCAAPPSFGIAPGLLTTSAASTTSAAGFTFSTIPVPSTSTGPTGLLGTGGQTGATSLFGIRPGLQCSLLWSPYGIGQTIIFSSCRFFVLCFFFFLLFFPRMISSAADWMSAILPHVVWP